MADLKPCPFCGSTNLTIVCDEDEYFVGCYTCHTCGPAGGTTKEGAIEAWNLRVRKEDCDDG